MTSQTRERIESICRTQWELRGVDPVSVVEMLDELRTHLDAAAADGKTPTDVVGDDVQAFAAAWAVARESRARRWRRLVLDVGSMLVLLLGYLHLRTWSAEVRVLLAVAIAVGVGALVIAVAELRRGPLGFWLWQAPIALAVVGGIVLDRLVLHGAVLVTVPLWVTAPLALLASARAVRDVRRSTAARRPPGTAVTG